jgi:hypothetical protein
MEVDFGSMHLTVGEDHAPSDGSARVDEADPLIVSRFRSLLNDRPPQAAPEAGADEELPSPFALLSAADAIAHATPSKVAGALEQMWVGNGASGIREVRMRMHEQVLPGTWVRLYETEGFLQIDLTASTEAVRRWLGAALPALVQDLGARLKRPLRVSVLMPQAENGAAAASAEWPAG